MQCDEFKDSTYGSELFCRTCGMDIGLNSIKRRDEIYCCEDCTKAI
ncbi:hypothetical protein GOV06_02280 [Candidatus Woesearchaeota archaeon]|nr:hypothetical protein [Candidatus Woesearchaeota archaeon]